MKIESLVHNSILQYDAIADLPAVGMVGKWYRVGGVTYIWNPDEQSYAQSSCGCTYTWNVSLTEFTDLAAAGKLIQGVFYQISDFYLSPNFGIQWTVIVVPNSDSSIQFEGWVLWGSSVLSAYVTLTPSVALSRTTTDMQINAAQVLAFSSSYTECIRGTDVYITSAGRVYRTVVLDDFSLRLTGLEDIDTGETGSFDPTTDTFTADVYGAGDMVGANNLSEIADYVIARSNLGLRDIELPSNWTTTSSTLADVTGMAASLDANSKYRGEMIFALSGSTGGLRFAFTVPSGTTMVIGFTGATTSANGQSMAYLTVTSGAEITYTFSSSSLVSGFVEIEFFIATDATAGDMQVMAKSNTNGQSNTIYAGLTHIEIRKTEG